MTTARVTDVARGRAATVRPKPTCAGLLRDDLVAMLADSLGLQWPDPKYWERPRAFAEEILGMKVWDAQERILEAYVQYPRVSVTSGHKIGKSNTAAIIALHFYCSKPDARVVFTSTTARQVDSILWRELGKIRSKAGCCVVCREACKKARRPEPRPCPHSSLIQGKMNSIARSGFHAEDYREIVGFTAREPEGVAGVSGANLLYLPDEASGIDDAIFEAIEGNRAGGARMVMFSNPTRSEGEFFLSHTDKALQFDNDGAPICDANGKQIGFYKAITVSSEETPNVKERREVIPGLATYEWVEEKRLEWGEDSALYKIRVQGKFVTSETGKIVSVALITEAEERWRFSCVDGADGKPGPYAMSLEDGPLHIGVDPAGDGEGSRDEIALVPRRGFKVPEFRIRRKLSKEGIVAEVLSLIAQYAKPRETTIVLVDREGTIGYDVWRALLEYSEANPGVMVVVGIRSSDAAVRAPHLYERVRDELWANVREWLKDGGELPPDAKAAKELHAPEWIGSATKATIKATSKKELRRALGRSPDRADGLCLATWTPRSIEAQIALGQMPAAAPPAPPVPQLFAGAPNNGVGGAANPYAGGAWGGR